MFLTKIAKTKFQKGFTLLELLVVISIIGILIAMGSVSFSAAQKKGRDARRKEDMKAIQNAQEQYYTEHSSVYKAACGEGETIDISTGNDFLIPTDPKASGSYHYTHPTCTTSVYCICALLEDTGKGNSDASCNWTSSGNYFCISNRQ